MTNDDALGAVSETVGSRVRKIREALGWSVEQLAAACAALGALQLTVNAIYALESGRKDRATGRRRRHITVDELLALAAALHVHPVDLLVSAELPDDAPVELAPGVSTTAAKAREWIGGRAFLYEPETLAEFAEAIRGMPKTRAQELSRAWFTRERMDEMNRAALAWQAENDPPMPGLASAIENVVALAKPEDRDRLVRQMVGTLGEVTGPAGLQQLADELKQHDQGEERDG